MTHDQKQHWDEVYAKKPDFFGDEPSIFVRQAPKKTKFLIALGASLAAGCDS